MYVAAFGALIWLMWMVCVAMLAVATLILLTLIALPMLAFKSTRQTGKHLLTGVANTLMRMLS